jgi:glycosyltransferase involved in cell wall biosynthesis
MSRSIVYPNQYSTKTHTPSRVIEIGDLHLPNVTKRQICVDATCWNNNRGYGRHLRGLLKSLIRLDVKNSYTLIIDSPSEIADLPAQAEVHRVDCSRPAVVAASSESHRSVPDMWRVSRAMSDKQFDILLFPTVYSYVPVFSRAKKVVLIHDIIAESYPTLTVPRLSSRLLWKTKAKLGRWQADALVTVSDYSRRGIAKAFNIPVERIFVVGEASDPIFRRIANPILTQLLRSKGIEKNRQYLTYVGGFGPHKNLNALVSAFHAFTQRPEGRTALMVMVGENKREAFHTQFDLIARQVTALGIADKVLFTGYLPDEDLVILLNLSTALVLPSLMEGFGLPAIEAVACGCPVIATSESPLPELLGEGCEYFDPSQPQELENAITSLFASEKIRNQRREFGLKAVQRLSWDEAARQMMAVLQSVMGVEEAL